MTLTHSRAHHSWKAFVFVLPVLLAAGCSHSRSQAAAAPQPPAVEFVGEWGTPGDDPGQLNDPVGPAVDDEERVYLADRGQGSVDKFEASGVPLLSFDYPVVRNAAGIAVDRGGGIYVADTHGGQVQIFFPEGDFIRAFHIAAQRNWQGPFGFSVDESGRVFLPDSNGGRIQVLDSHGRLERSWKLPASAEGQPGHPAMVMAAPDGSIYVGEWETGRIMKYSSDGRQITPWGPVSGSAAPLLGLAVSAKYLFALRDATPRLEIWTLDGHVKMTDDLGGRLNGASPSKASLAVSNQDELVVLDPEVPRVLRFRIHLDAP